MLNAATPVGAVSNTMTSSGSKVPDRLRNLMVSEWINVMTCDLPTPPGPLRNTVWFNWFALFQRYDCLFTPVTMEHDYDSFCVIQLSQKVSIFISCYLL